MDEAARAALAEAVSLLEARGIDARVGVMYGGGGQYVFIARVGVGPEVLDEQRDADA